MSEFLRELFQGAEEGYITLVRFGDNGRPISTRIPVTQPELADGYVGEHNVTLYYNVGLCRSDLGPSVRGSKADVSAVACLWMDIDLPKIDSKKNYPPEGHVMGALADMPLKYSALVHTGGGLHVYWFFNEPQTFSLPSDAEAFEGKLSKPWSNLFKVKLARYGQYDIDSIFDVSRMMRIPGSWHKNGRQCVVSEANYALRYSAEDFATYVEEIDVNKLMPSTYVPKLVKRPDGTLNLVKLDALIHNCPNFKKTWDHKNPKLPSGSEYDTSLARHAIDAGWNDEEIANLIWAHNEKHTPERLNKLCRATPVFGTFLASQIAFARRKAAESRSSTSFDPEYVEPESDGPDGFAMPPAGDGEGGVAVAPPPSTVMTRAEMLQKASTILGVPVARWIQVGRENPLFTLVTAEGKSIRVGGEVAVVDGWATFNRRLYSELGVQIPEKYKNKKEWNNLLRGLAMLVEVVDAPEVTTASMAQAGIAQYLEEKRFGREKDRDNTLRIRRAYYDGKKVYINMQDLVKHLNMHGGGHKWNNVEMVSALTSLGFEREVMHYRIDSRESTASYWSKDASVFQDLIGP